MATARTVTAPGPSLTSTRSAASTRASSMSRLGVRVAPVRSVRGAAGDSSPGAPIAALSRASCSSLKRGTLLSGVVELCSIVVARRSTNGVAMNSFPPSAPAVAPTRPAHRAPEKKSLFDSVADPGRRRWWGLAALCLGALLVGIDNTIVNVALPTIGRDLNASISDLQWVVDGYTLVFATLLLLAGHLGDRFGRRRLLLIGLAVFAATSIAASFATSTPALIAGRAAMGIGAAMIFPATLALLVALFADRRERAAAIGVWSGVTGLSVALGPIGGGLLVEHFDWSAVFLVNVPLAAIAIVATRLLVRESRDPQPGRFDPLGAFGSMVWVGLLVWTIIEAPGHGWGSAVTI